MTIKHFFSHEFWTAFGEHTTSTVRSMPRLLAIIMGFFALYIFASFWTIILQCLMVAVGIGTFSVNGVQVRREEFLPAAWKTYLGFLGSWLVLGPVSFSLWARKKWARELIMFLLIVVFGFEAYQRYIGEADTGNLVTVAIPTFFMGWYLYFRRNVTKYFGDEA